jgi:hypothetical protein
MTVLDSKIALLVRNKVIADRIARGEDAHSSNFSLSISPHDSFPLPPPVILSLPEMSFREVKRCIRNVLQVQPGNNLETVLSMAVTDEDEEEWENIVLAARTRLSSRSASSSRLSKALPPPMNDLHE